MIEVDLSTILIVVGAILAPLVTCIGVLWARDGQWREDYNAMVDRMQTKIDATNDKAITAINAATNQMNSSAALLVSIQGTLAKMDDKWTDLREEILRALVK